MSSDPIEDAGPCRCGDPHCPCGRCHGQGWVYVGTSYAERQVPSLTLEQAAEVATLGPEAQAHVDLQIHYQRVAAANSCYPCQACNADAFYRWRDHHYDPDHAEHNRATCAGCQDEPTRRRRKAYA